MYQPHPYANIFPMMSDEEMTSLVASMKENGYDPLIPIVLYDGMILDGRNRYAAAQKAGVEPTFMRYEGDDVLAYAIRLNLQRRHLDSTQRAVVANRLATMKHGGNRGANQHDSWQEANLPLGVTQSQAAEMLNVSERTIKTVKAVERDAPELIPLMEAGKMTAHEAMKEVKKIVKDNKGSTLDIPKEDSELIKRMKTGQTVVINIDKNFHALKYAKDNDLYVQVDRWSDWGNPYLIGQDGDRDQVIESYEIYFARKFGLQKKLHTLKGKALGCHCYPERCHGDHLKALADGK
jgi:ParB-like chromosome segregation protein Spo0J